MDQYLVERIICLVMAVFLGFFTFGIIIPKLPNIMLWRRGAHYIRKLLRTEKNPKLREQKKQQMIWLIENCDIFMSNEYFLFLMLNLFIICSCVSVLFGRFPSSTTFIASIISSIASTIFVIEYCKRIPLSSKEAYLIIARLSEVLPPPSEDEENN